MPDNSNHDLLLHDPLSEVTRKERRMLLGISMLGVAIAKTGLVPSKISALGIEFAESDQKALLTLLATIVLYFLAAFTVYAWSDFLAWRRALKRQRREFRVEYEREIKEFEGHVPDYDEPKYSGVFFAYQLPTLTSIVRAVFEFLLPLIVGIYGAIVLWNSGSAVVGT